MARLLLLAVLVVGTVQLPAAVEARRYSSARLRRVLRALRDRDMRVRVQALIALGRLGDWRATGAVTRILRRDRRGAVRAVAAAALGEIRDPAALATLRRSLRDRDRRVRRQARRAISRILPPTREIHQRAPDRARRRAIAIRLGAMGAKAPKAGHYRHALRGAWRDTMTRETGTKIVLLGDKGPTDGRTVYSVSSSITRLTRVRQGPMLKALCEISVTLDQNGSIVMMTSGGATVEAYPLRFGHREAQELETNALRAAVTSAHHNVMRFLAR